MLRIEDVDTQRAVAEIEQSQREDLRWLGLDWDIETTRQSERDYTPWLQRLDGQTYFCTCSRKMVRSSGGVYLGTCRDAGHTEGSVRFRTEAGPDPVLRRRDGIFTYTLAVVADDIADGVTEVVRGADLADAVAVQQALWTAFGASPPRWQHTPMILGAGGLKLAKSRSSMSLRAMRDAGWSAGNVLDLVKDWLAEPTGPITVQIPENGEPPSVEVGLHWSTGDPQ